MVLSWLSLSLYCLLCLHQHPNVKTPAVQACAASHGSSGLVRGGAEIYPVCIVRSAVMLLCKRLGTGIQCHVGAEAGSAGMSSHPVLPERQNRESYDMAQGDPETPAWLLLPMQSCCDASHHATAYTMLTSAAGAKGTVLIHNAEELQNYSRGEEDRLEAIIKGISDAGAKVRLSCGR